MGPSVLTVRLNNFSLTPFNNKPYNPESKSFILKFEINLCVTYRGILFFLALSFFFFQRQLKVESLVCSKDEFLYENGLDIRGQMFLVRVR